jgi:hypothetical protein
MRELLLAECCAPIGAEMPVFASCSTTCVCFVVAFAAPGFAIGAAVVTNTDFATPLPGRMFEQRSRVMLYSRPTRSFSCQWRELVPANRMVQQSEFAPAE